MSAVSLVAAGASAAAVGWFVRERGLRRTHAVSPGVQKDVVLPHSEEFELYHNAFSLCSKKVRMCLAELGVAHRAHHVDLIETGRYGTLSRSFLAVNPSAVVPVLVHRGHPVYESHEIIVYAAMHAHSGVRLVPEDPAAAARMADWVHRSSLLGDRPVDDLKVSAGNCVPGLTLPLFAAMIGDIPTVRIAEGLLFHRLRVRPLLFLVMKAAGLARLPALRPAMALVRTSHRWMGRHLDDLEAELAQGGPWILGEQFTLADVSWAVILDRLREADWEASLLGARRPHVTRYWDRIRDRPSYRAAMTEHEHPTVRLGTERLIAKRRSDPVFDAAVYGPS